MAGKDRDSQNAVALFSEMTLITVKIISMNSNNADINMNFTLKINCKCRLQKKIFS